jgi:hypothetical protein
MLTKMIGAAAAQSAWRRSRLALFNLRARIADLGIRCRAESAQSLYLAGTTLGPLELRNEAEARRRAGIGASFLTRQDLRAAFGIDRPLFRPCGMAVNHLA